MGPTSRNEGCGFRSEAARDSGMTHGAPGGSELSSFITVCQPLEVSSNLLVTAYASDGVRSASSPSESFSEDDLPACVRSALTARP
jgi:hypothetical protein